MYCRSLEAGNMVEQVSTTGNAATMGRAEMSEDDGLGSIEPPPFLPPASYYKDVTNHVNIASTMLVTARRAVGFEPNLVGQGVTDQQMMDFLAKFSEWMFELRNYWPYIEIKASKAQAVWFHSIDEGVSQFLASFGSFINRQVLEAWRGSLTGLVKGSSSHVSQHGATVAFQTDILDTSGGSNAALPLTFGRTVQSSTTYDSVLTSATLYVVDSNAIIASADHFAQNGLTIFGARQYRDYVNNVRP